MDLAETMFNRKAFIRERGAEVFRKICPSPTLLVPFKDYPTAVQDDVVTLKGSQIMGDGRIFQKISRLTLLWRLSYETNLGKKRSQNANSINIIVWFFNN